MPETVKIRDIEAEPGRKTFGYIRVYESPTYVADMPIGIVNGSEPGPTLCLTGSLYGGLLHSGIEAVIRTWKQTNPKKLGGVLLTVPVVDVPSFDFRSPHKSPIDGLNVSSCFPGKPDGTVSQVIAYTVLNDMISKSNYHIDLRSGNVDEASISFTGCCKTGNSELDAKAASMAEIYGTEVILLMTGKKMDEGKIIKETCKYGVTSIIASVGMGMGRMDKNDVTTHMRGVENVMKFLEMLEGAPKIREKKLKITIPPTYIVCTMHQGLFYPKVKCGSIVSEGEYIGEIKNLMGEILEEIVAPVNGVVHTIFNNRLVKAGEVLLKMRRFYREWRHQFIKEWLDRFLED